MDSVAAAVAAPQRDLARQYARVRDRSVQLAAPLSAEDAMLQSMADASPSKWHLAHTTWFFERFVLAGFPAAPAHDPGWDYLFNSYYKSIGPAHARPQRGLLSRPSLQQVQDYRCQIDAQVQSRLDAGDLDDQALQHLQLGLQHEQQHQELLLTDIKHAFWSNPLQPAYREDLPTTPGAASAQGWIESPERIVTVGAASWPHHAVFAYDNESPPHRVLLPAHALAERPLSNAEYRAFIDAGGYREPRWWLSEGWALRETEDWQHPLYWDDTLQREYTLGGWRELDPHAPVCHLSYFEADACARWAGARLPSEFEWEAAAASQPVRGHFADDDHLHPQVGQGSGLRQLFGDVWEWTHSAYGAYPGFRPFAGNLGEYNGKFMCGQWVLRGGSCATPRGHVRASYRNFFMPPARWQFSGLRLARDLS
ncbi:TPA: ergothioneine biosynthesis protein EgtB [Stenotrophomonas maltophilia]|uniref:ergothioneine biosynthesis protein EgtB n=1 Tax=Stenotrophomonas maltophilia group TaxID=995085 RepID=UPI0018D3AC4C|nr:ergothioneine biosynthesis protein EgtB [Stenotrophomonas maltophilia]MBH1864915.1 ergothioneine biosynthesis protein EgtB [Stenotrophomonas maltophilia]